MMKFTTKALLLANAASVVAFAPPRPHSSTTQTNHQFQQQCRFPQQQPQQSSSALPLFPDPSTLESSTLLTSDLIDSFVNTVGSLALLGSVGFGVFSGMKDEDWEYEYKAGNEEAKLKYGSNADLALIGMSEAEVAEDMVKGQVTEAQKSFFGKKDEATAAVAPQKTTPPPNEATPAQKSFFGKVKAAATPAPKEPKPSVPVVTAQPAKASNPSDTVLKATEVAKSEVQKKGVQETKQKMSSKSASAAATSTPSPAAETKTEEVKSKEVTEVKKEKGNKRKLAKAATLVVAAGAVAVARNVIMAWLGRGIM
mmetsp:Transcript_5739/g.8581  ORF Transcript_5739/g.8581 Transcript_5739/m.8581 type:complete len:311 (+) Transcript_5739:114-1046(+)